MTSVIHLRLPPPVRVYKERVIWPARRSCAAGRSSATRSTTHCTTPSRCSTAATRASRSPAAAGRSSARPSPSSRGRPTRPCRRSSACATPARTARTTSPAPASSGRRSPRSGAMGPSRDDMVLRGHHRRPARRPQDAAAGASTTSAATPTPPARCEAWTRSPSRRSGCSRRRSLADALDLSKEDADAWSTGTAPATRRCSWTATAPRGCRRACCMARRLVEAGARVVTLNYSKWDWHGGKNAEGRADNSIFLREQEDFPVFDQCVSALVEDLHDRGLDRGLHGRHHGRVRPHAEDQRPGRPRPLAAGELRPAGRRRDADRPGDRRDRPDRRRGGVAGR